VVQDKCREEGVTALCSCFREQNYILKFHDPYTAAKEIITCMLTSSTYYKYSTFSWDLWKWMIAF